MTGQAVATQASTLGPYDGDGGQSVERLCQRGLGLVGEASAEVGGLHRAGAAAGRDGVGATEQCAQPGGIGVRRLTAHQARARP